METAHKALLGVGAGLLVVGIVGYVIAATNSSALSTRLFVECGGVPTSPACLQILSDLAYWGIISGTSAGVAAIGVLFVIIGVVLEAVKASPRPGAPVAVAPPPMPYGPAGRTCAQCGSIVPPGWAFCGRCGARV
ncbi:MAG: hypothetical protein ACT4OI_01195 [Methanobacteriota archaeon]